MDCVFLGFCGKYRHESTNTASMISNIEYWISMCCCTRFHRKRISIDFCLFFIASVDTYRVNCVSFKTMARNETNNSSSFFGGAHIFVIPFQMFVCIIGNAVVVVVVAMPFSVPNMNRPNYTETKIKRWNVQIKYSFNRSKWNQVECMYKDDDEDKSRNRERKTLNR